jgi:hypothetical protein
MAAMRHAYSGRVVDSKNYSLNARISPSDLDFFLRMLSLLRCA